MTGIAKNTVVKLLVELGERPCTAYQDETLRNLPCKRLQCDEIWSFVGAKDKNVPAENEGEFGRRLTCWTWTAIDADTKLIAVVAGRHRATPAAAYEFMQDMAVTPREPRAAHDGRPQAYLDGGRSRVRRGHRLRACSMKIYGVRLRSEKRYSPADVHRLRRAKSSAATRTRSTSPRRTSSGQNLTMRMSMRRFTRLTNAFSARRSRTTRQRWRSTSCITTSAACIRRSA